MMSANTKVSLKTTMSQDSSDYVIMSPDLFDRLGSPNIGAFYVNIKLNSSTIKCTALKYDRSFPQPQMIVKSESLDKLFKIENAEAEFRYGEEILESGYVFISMIDFETKEVKLIWKTNEI